MDYVKWVMRGGSREVGHMRWVTRGGLREVPSKMFHSLIFSILIFGLVR